MAYKPINTVTHEHYSSGNTVKQEAIRHLHKVLCEYKLAEARFIEVEERFLATWFNRNIQPEYDKAEEVWFALGDEAFALASIIMDNTISYDCFERLINFHLEELIRMTAVE